MTELNIESVTYALPSTDLGYILIKCLNEFLLQIKDVSFILFFSQAFGHVEFLDFLPAFIKSFFFGGVIGLIGCYKGYTAGRGTESVGAAANSAVVLSSLLVIVVDMIAVQITDLL